MHFSRMRTAPLLTVSRSGGGCLSNPCDARWEANTRPPPQTEGMTHACENITLPQTLFAGGNKEMRGAYSKDTARHCSPLTVTVAIPQGSSQVSSFIRGSVPGISTQN